MDRKRQIVNGKTNFIQTILKKSIMKTDWNKLAIIITTIIYCISSISCASVGSSEIEIKEQETKEFFRQWHTESQQILAKNKAKGELQKSINEILALFLSKDEEADLKQRFPKLEYQIVQESIKVSMYKELGQTPKEQNLIFSEVYFKHSLSHDNSHNKILVYTPKYQQILQKKLPYGFTDQTEKQNKNARATLIKMGGNFKYDIPAQIYISFNQELNSAIVYRYREGSFGTPFWFRYSKENNHWKYDGIKFNLHI